MKTQLKYFGLPCLILLLFVFTGFAQELPPNSIGNEVYTAYKANGIDKAISKYHQLKKKEKKELTQADLNLVGYKIMNEDKDMDAAGKIFKLNMEEYPKAANPYDSYGDYLVAKGNEEEAREYFKKSAEMSKDSKDDWEKNTLHPQTKSKIAKIDKKDKQLNFLVGDWNIDAKGYQDGKEAAQMKGNDKVEYDENANALIFHHFDDQQNSEGMRILAYDAVDDEFDVAYLSPSSLQGIQMSSMKMKNVGKNKYEFMDRYTTRNGKEMTMKHEMERVSDNEIKWVIFEKTDEGSWQKVYAMDMKK